jgi:nucleoside-diphosphate-sugar epimerase
LSAAGTDVVVLDLLPPARRVPGVRYAIGDVRDRLTIRAALRGADGVFHLAAAHHDSCIEQQTYFDVNQTGTENLCEEMSATGVASVCFFSTCAVYGNAPEPRTESSTAEPVGPYGTSKLAAEAALQDWAARSPERRLLILRPPAVFGPGNYANMYSLIDQIARRRYAQVGAGSNCKSLAYVENLVAATLTLWRNGTSGVFNYVDKPDLTSAAITACIRRALGRSQMRLSIPLGAALAAATPIEMASRLLGRDPRISLARIRKFAHDRTVFEADKVRTAGFAPAISLEEGITRMVQWYVHEGAALGATARIPPSATVSGVRYLEVEAG